MKQLVINGLEVELEKKRIKNMYLKILPPEGKIHISAPQRISEEEIRRFVLSKLDWIEEQQGKIRQRNFSKELQYITGEEIPVWGRTLLLQLDMNGKRNSVIVTSTQIYLTVKDVNTIQKRKKVLDDWYRKALVQQLPDCIAKWELLIGVKSSGYQIRDMKTRWGTCNIRTGQVCFNLQLAKKHPKCLEYVVVHELVHLLEKSHNHIFKAYMDKYLPEWRNIKKELNSNAF